MRLRSFLVFCALLLSALPVLAKAYFASKSEMIANSELIALVDIKEVEACKLKRRTWTYGQKARAVVEKTLKGGDPGELTIYGAPDFICATTSLVPGRALVFLNHEGDGYIGSNWQYSIRPVQDDRLEWFNGENYSPLKNTTLPVVLSEITAKLPTETKLHGDYQKLLAAPAVDEALAAYHKLVTVKGNRTQLEYIIARGTPAGRLLATVLLYHLDNDAGRASLIRLSRNNGTVIWSKKEMAISEIAYALYGDGRYRNIVLK